MSAASFFDVKRVEVIISKESINTRDSQESQRNFTVTIHAGMDPKPDLSKWKASDWFLQNYAG